MARWHRDEPVSSPTPPTPSLPSLLLLLVVPCLLWGCARLARSTEEQFDVKEGRAVLPAVGGAAPAVV